MKIRLLLLNFLCFSVFNVLIAEPPSYIQTEDGVIVFTDAVFTGTSNAVKPEVISNNIIRVVAAPGKEIDATQSLVTTYSRRPDLSWNTIPSKESLGAQNKKNDCYTVGERKGWFRAMLLKSVFCINIIKFFIKGRNNGKNFS